MRTNKEIQVEIAALKKLVPVGRFKFKTAQSIRLVIDELQFPFDQTSAEWNELTDEQRDRIQQVLDWKEHLTEDKVSLGWGDLVKH